MRAVLGIDNPWKHVCSNSSQDNPPGYCNEPANRNGNPTIVPADPNEYPGGPAAYDELPRPQLGCSAIDVTLHGETAGNCPPGQNYSYPYPGGKRLVVAGDRSKMNCDGGGQAYQGYFDCALSTPCDPAVFSNAICGGSSVRKACVNGRRLAPDHHSNSLCVESQWLWREHRNGDPGIQSDLERELHAGRNWCRGVCHARDDGTLDGQRLL